MDKLEETREYRQQIADLNHRLKVAKMSGQDDVYQACIRERQDIMDSMAQSIVKPKEGESDGCRAACES